MTNSTTRVFIDTNCFIHLRDLKDLPWQEIFDSSQSVQIMIASTVIAELDSFKFGKDRRKRNRARSALELIERASSKRDGILLKKDRSIEIRICVLPNTIVDWSELPGLDKAKPDHQLLANAISDGDAALLTHDTGLRIAARTHEVQAFGPPKGWLLPDETTDEQREIQRLKKELAEALSTRPKIRAGLQSSLDLHTARLDFIVPVLDPLSDAARSELINNYLQRHKKFRVGSAHAAVIDHFALLSGYGKPEVERYNREFQKFEDEVAAFFSELPKRLREAGRILKIRYELKNDSTVAAQGLRIDTRLSSEMVFCPGDRQAASVTPPDPPDKPELRPLTNNPFTPNATVLFPGAHDHQRDPAGFYWIERPQFGASYSALQCEDFRPTRIWRGQATVWVRDTLPCDCSANIEISATNLPAPLTLTANIKVHERRMSWDDPDLPTFIPWITEVPSGTVRKPRL